MKSTIVTSLCIAILAICGSSCKSEFERVRTSGDPALTLEKADTYFEGGEYLKAQTLYELVVSNYRGRPEAEQIAYNYAYTYYNLEQYLLSSHYFKSFSSTYGSSDLKEDADFMQAYSNYKMSPTYRLDQSYTAKAIDGLQEFINQYPSNERVSECNDLIDEMRAKLEIKDYESGLLYFDLQQYQSAIRSFENLLIDFPDTKRAENVRYMTVRSAFLLAKNSFVEKQAERHEEVLKHAELFLSRHANSDYVKEVQEMRSNSQERLKQLDDVRYQK